MAMQDQLSAHGAIYPVVGRVRPQASISAVRTDFAFSIARFILCCPVSVASKCFVTRIERKLTIVTEQDEEQRCPSR